MKVCMISSYPPEGRGIADYTVHLMKEMPGFVDIFPWNFKGRFRTLLGPLVNFNKLRKILKEYDIVHVQYHIGEYLFLFLPLLSILPKKAKIVLTLHEDDKVFNILIRWFHKIFYNAADLLIVHTTTYSIRSDVVIPVGMMERTERRSPVPFKILLPGYIATRKGSDIAVKAIEEVRKAFPQIKLYLLGKPHPSGYINTIKRLIKEKHLESNVIVIDRFIPLNEFWLHFKTADICVMPHREASVSGVFYHSISWGIPTIASDLLALRWASEDKALYFKNEDHMDLAKQIIYLLRNKKIKDQMEYDFKELSKKHSLRRTAELTVEQYYLLLGNKHQKTTENFINKHK